MGLLASIITMLKLKKMTEGKSFQGRGYITTEIGIRRPDPCFPPYLRVRPDNAAAALFQAILSVGGGSWLVLTTSVCSVTFHILFAATSTPAARRESTRCPLCAIHPPDPHSCPKQTFPSERCYELPQPCSKRWWVLLGWLMRTTAACSFCCSTRPIPRYIEQFAGDRGRDI